MNKILYFRQGYSSIQYLMKSLNTTLNEKLRKIREIRGFSQEYVARKMDTEQETISYLETKQKNIPDETLRKLADLYGVTVDFIKNFDLQEFFNNNLNDQSGIFFSIEKVIIDTKECVDKIFENMNSLFQRISEIEKKMNK